jgi:serine protease Do
MRLLTRAAALLLIAFPAYAQPADGHKRSGVLRELNNAVEALVRRVSPSVVQVLVTSHGPRDGAERDSSFEIVRQSTVGSGVILDSDGYIVTNAHLLIGAIDGKRQNRGVSFSVGRGSVFPVA